MAGFMITKLVQAAWKNRDELPALTKINPVLIKGEIKIVVNSKLADEVIGIKIGDGTTPFNSLPFISDMGQGDDKNGN